VLKLITTDEEYKLAPARLEIIFDAQPKTKEGEELEVLGNLIYNYEKKRISMENSE